MTHIINATRRIQQVIHDELARVDAHGRGLPAWSPEALKWLKQLKIALFDHHQGISQPTPLFPPAARSNSSNNFPLFPRTPRIGAEAADSSNPFDITNSKSRRRAGERRINSRTTAQSGQGPDSPPHRRWYSRRVSTCSQVDTIDGLTSITGGWVATRNGNWSTAGMLPEQDDAVGYSKCRGDFERPITLARQHQGS